MAVYKVIQDIEAEDKLVGPLTLRQFIYAGIAAVCGYLGFVTASKGAPFMLAIFVPIIFVFGFFAFPWHQDQPTEVWALARIRFMMKPRKRVWDQSGTKDLVTVTAPKVIARHPLTNGLSQDEVHSRLNALASTIDSRGWAIKSADLNVSTAPAPQPAAASDRLAAPSVLPQVGVAADVTAADDILNEDANPVAQHFDSMISAAGVARRQQVIAQMQHPETYTAPTQQPASWFMQGQPAATGGYQTQASDSATSYTTQMLPAYGAQAAIPTPEEEALVPKLKAEHNSQTAAYGHLKTLKTPEQLVEEARSAKTKTQQVVNNKKAHKKQASQPKPPAEPPVTPQTQAVIMNLAHDNDKDIGTLARQAHQELNEENEVVISLH